MDEIDLSLAVDDDSRPRVRREECRREKGSGEKAEDQGIPTNRRRRLRERGVRGR
jgi:hypothetical protein